MYGMDREAINEAFFNGQQPPANSWLPPSHPAHNPDVQKYPYDPERAAELLDEAGWTLGSDGIRRNAAGDALKITYINIAGDRPREQVAAAIQANWLELGIEATIEPQTSRLLFSDTLPQNTMVPGGVAVWRWVIDGAQAAQYAKSFWYPSDDVGGSYDLLRWDSDWGQIERNVELIEEGLQTLDREKRYELLREQQALWAENLPVLPIYWFKRVATVDERVQGVKLGTAPQVGWNAEEWEFVEP
jgi:peptide/nickel transport system substrate-binding protein